MRVAYLLTQDRGGPVDVAVRLAAALQAGGEAEVKVFGPVPARDSHLVEHEEVSVPHKGDLRASRQARAALRAWQPDVVHAQDRRSGLVCAGLGDIPVVHTYHGVPDDVTEPWFRGAARAPRPSTYTMTVLAADALVARRVNRTIVPSPAMGKFLRERLRVPAHRIAHIDNCVPIGAAEPPGMWICAGVTGCSRAGARRRGPSVAYRRVVSANQTTNRTRRRTGKSDRIASQSGWTKIAATDRSESMRVCGDGDGEGTIAAVRYSPWPVWSTKNMIPRAAPSATSMVTPAHSTW